MRECISGGQVSMAGVVGEELPYEALRVQVACLCIGHGQYRQQRVAFRVEELRCHNGNEVSCPMGQLLVLIVA